MANDVYQLQIIASVAGEFVENVLNFVSTELDGANPGASAAAFLLEWQADNQVAWLAAVSSDYELGGYKAKRVNNTGGPEAVLLAGGAAGTFPSPSAVSGLGAVLTAAYLDTVPPPGKYRRTRIFVPGLPIDGWAEGAIQPALRTALETLATQIAAPVAAGGQTYQYCAYSRATASVFTTGTPAISIKLGAQRRRYKPVI